MNIGKVIRPAVIGLGYVGLPLAVAIAKHYKTFGFDIDSKRVDQLNHSVDVTGEVEENDLNEAKNLDISDDPSELQNCNLIIITVPTPIDSSKSPDFGPLISASNLAAKYLNVGDVVVYESTVYPGATEEVCVPVLEKISKLTFNKEFFVGYSPERINPGDKNHRISDIVKITSGSSESTAQLIDDFYATFITAGTFKVGSIAIAEAAKVIENTQRDVNIALINELSILFNKLGIDTHSVLQAAATKWNFLHFVPGLVGGHCIGIDPYYLMHKALMTGYYPKIIQTGREINDSMPQFVVENLILSLAKAKFRLEDARVVILGATFKENCPDMRNSKVLDLISLIEDYGITVEIMDPHISDLANNYDLKCTVKSHLNGKYNAIILAVAHEEFKKLSASELRSCLVQGGKIFDLKNLLQVHESDFRL